MRTKRKHRNIGKRLLAVCVAGAVAGAGIPAYGGVDGRIVQAKSAGAVQREETIEYPFTDTSLSFEERAADLVSRLTLEEKISLLTARRAEGISGVPRLGIEPWSWGGEANHGLSWVTPKISSFPTGSAMSCSWDKELIHEAADAISDEARGIRALIQETNNPGLSQLGGGSLSFWAPTMNLNRDPRWGRADESYGEDTYLTTELAGSYVEGMQGDDDTYLKTVPCLKHFLANNCEANRYNGSSDVDERTLREYYAKPFQEIIEETGISQVMTAYNSVNGVPMSVNTPLLDTMLRKTWGFDGLVVTDCGAINNIVNDHKWVPEGWDHSVNGQEAVAFAMNAGTDLNCGKYYRQYAQEAIDEGLLAEEDLDRALLRAFTERMKTGEFDPDEMVEYTNLTKDELGSAEHVALTEKVANDSVVMLKNDPAQEGEDPILPLDGTKLQSIALVGDGSLTEDVELGGYSIHTPIHSTSPIQGLRDKMEELNPQAEVTLHDYQSANATNPYLFNIDKFVLETKTGETITLEAEEGEPYNCVNEGSNIGYVEPNGAFLRFPGKNIDLKNIAKITAVASCDSRAMGGIIECQYGTPNFQPNGTALASAKITSTGSWTSWQNFEMEVDAGEAQLPEDGDLYFAFKKETGGNLSEEDREAIAQADTAVVYVGTIEGTDAREDMDRKNLDLPRNQAELIQEVAQLNPNTVVYIQSVAQVNLEPFVDQVPAILWVGYNGQEQGKAFANILFGDVNPNGRLNYTWYQEESQIPSITEYEIRSDEESNGRTYQYFSGDIRYPFGYGLSYTDFAYSNITIDRTEVTPNDQITVTADVTNIGKITGKEVAQLYITSPDAEEKERPVKRLKGFEKVELEPGETKTVTFEVPMDELYYWDEEQDKRIYDLGEYQVEVGASSQDIKLTETFTMEGELDRKLNVITASPDRFIFDLDKGITASGTEVTANMNDETFFDVEKAVVRYESSNEEVATVNGRGKIQAVGGGTATITVSVQVEGVTKSVDFPVVVRQTSGLQNIFVDGKDLTGFQPGNQSYDCLVEGETVPVVTAEAAEGVSCEIKQAESVPGTAVITVSSGTEEAQYTIAFYRLPESTDFTTGVLDDSQWKIQGEDKEHWSIDEEGLKIATQKGDIIQSQSGLKNLFLQDASGNWTLDVKLKFSVQPTERFQQGALLIYQDDDNYLKMTCEGSDGKTIVKLAGEQQGATIPDNPENAFTGTTLYYRLRKEGDSYTGWFSTDGESYQSLGSKTISLIQPRVGLMATNSNQGEAPSIDVIYEYVNFSDQTEKTCTCGLYDLQFEGKTLSRPASCALSAEAKVRGGCVMEGHGKDEIAYEFTIADGALNTSGAKIEDGVLKASRAGEVEVTVKASLHEAEPIAAQAVFVIEGDMVREQLDQLIALIDGLNPEEYTAQSWAQVEEALTAAKAVRDNAAASQKELDSAVSSLIAAFGNLEYGVQKLHLQIAIEAAQAILDMEQNYEDLTALAAAVESGKAVLADQTADQEAVDKAAYEILDELFAVAKTADVQSLESLIEAAKGLLDGNFTSDSLKNLQDAIDRAEAVVADQDRDQVAIGNAYADLVEAIRKMERKGNKAALKAIIEKAEGILGQADAYTASSLEGLEQALSDAKAVYDNEDAVQSAVNEAVETLTWHVTEARLLGDVDGNGAVTTSDTAAVLRASAELATLSEKDAESADVNGDGIADTKDAALILQYAAEQITKF